MASNPFSNIPLLSSLPEPTAQGLVLGFVVAIALVAATAIGIFEFRKRKAFIEK